MTLGEIGCDLTFEPSISDSCSVLSHPRSIVDLKNKDKQRLLASELKQRMGGGAN